MHASFAARFITFKRRSGNGHQRGHTMPQCQKRAPFVNIRINMSKNVKRMWKRAAKKLGQVRWGKNWNGSQKTGTGSAEWLYFLCGYIYNNRKMRNVVNNRNICNKSKQKQLNSKIFLFSLKNAKIVSFYYRDISNMIQYHSNCLLLYSFTYTNSTNNICADNGVAP